MEILREQREHALLARVTIVFTFHDVQERRRCNVTALMNFSKVSSKVILYRKFSREHTFEIVHFTKSASHLFFGCDNCVIGVYK